MKNHPVRAELFHVQRQMGRQTDMIKLIGAFCNFANVPNNGDDSH
jgi:hypothetical protein